MKLASRSAAIWVAFWLLSFSAAQLPAISCSPQAALPIPSAETAQPADPEERRVWSRLRTIARAGVPEPLAGTWTELASLRSLHLKAQVEVWVAASAGTGGRELWGAGSFESWAEGKRSRASAQVPPALGLVQWTDVAFDGEQLAAYQAQDGILSVRRGAPRFWPLAYRDPVSLVMFFLNPFDEADCARCELRLSDLHGSLPTALARRSISGSPLLLSVPPARFGKQAPSGYRLSELPETDDRGGHPQMIELVTQGGAVLERVELRNYNPVAGQSTLKFPWRLTYEIFDESGPLIRTIYKIEHIEANQGIAAETFQLTIPGARVWSEELRTFVH